MYCKKCGANVSDQDNYCSTCGTKISLTLKDLRMAERRALREIKNLPDAKQLPCGQCLAEFCWSVAASQHHPSDNMFSADSPEVPEYVFDEVTTTKESAIRLFNFLVVATRRFPMLESMLMK